ncbi:MAG TPA: hypothetical protein VMV69_13940 [Pirellulales bacterium]|nr:hypothetical protein [Pirellulales bacterium]
MTLELVLPPGLEQRLQLEATRQGQSVGATTLQLLEKYLPPPDRRAEAIALLQASIQKANVATQAEKEEAASILRFLDEDHPSERQLFPDDMKGITW